LFSGQKSIKPVSKGQLGGLKFIHAGLFYKFATDNRGFLGGTDAASKVAGTKETE
jgi:hypothetical protein